GLALADNPLAEETAADSGACSLVFLARRNRSCRLNGTIAADHDDAGAEHDGHVRHVENAGPQRTKSDVHEVDDLAVGEAIHEVRRPTGDTQGQSEESRSGPAKSHRQRQSEQQHSVADPEKCRANRNGPACAEAQEGARVLDILEPKRVGQERPALRRGERDGRDVLGDSVTADRRADGNEQEKANADSGGRQTWSPPRAYYGGARAALRQKCKNARKIGQFVV